MRLLGDPLLDDFQTAYPHSGKVLNRWAAVVRAAEWHTFVDVKRTFNSADYVAPHVIFDIGGNKFRILSIIDFKESVVIVRSVMTHKEYDKWKP
ncbi:MAG: type II toxin-antitoxin system HigB family toxin [Terriglobia bacterium]